MYQEMIDKDVLSKDSIEAEVFWIWKHFSF